MQQLARIRSSGALGLIVRIRRIAVGFLALQGTVKRGRGVVG